MLLPRALPSAPSASWGRGWEEKEREEHLRYRTTWPHTRWTLFSFPLRVKEIETHSECTADPGPQGIKDFEQNSDHLSQACWATLPVTKLTCVWFLGPTWGMWVSCAAFCWTQRP